MYCLGVTYGNADKETKKSLSPPQDVTDSDLELGKDVPEPPPHDNISWIRQAGILFGRAFKSQTRQYDILIIQFLLSIIMGVLVGTSFLHLGNSQKSVKTRQALLFFNCIHQGFFGAVMVINSFPGERALILRERAAGMYYASAYFVSKTLAESLVQLIIPIIYSIPVYWLAGLQPEAGKFFLFVLFMILCNFAAVSLALVISAIGRTTDVAVTVLPLALEISRLLGGFFLPPTQLPKYFSWLDALSYAKYAYVGCAQNELYGLTYNCTKAELITVNGTTECPVSNGTQYLDSLGLNYITLGDCIGIMLSYIVGLRFIAYLGVRYIKH